jgi:hypothetical protein
MAQLGSLVVDGADPRIYDQLEKDRALADEQLDSTAIRPQQHALHDTSISFEEYYYYAQATRAEELNHPRTGRETKAWSLLFPSKSDGGVEQVSNGEDHHDTKRNLSNPNVRSYVSDEEWANASRALRTATRGAAFYLITTDILGPFALPYAFATMGWG